MCVAPVGFPTPLYSALDLEHTNVNRLTGAVFVAGKLHKLELLKTEDESNTLGGLIEAVKNPIPLL